MSRKKHRRRSYNAGYDDGYNSGYKRGYDNGFVACCRGIGFSNGHDVLWRESTDEYTLDRQRGFDQGYCQGYQIGYDEAGYEYDYWEDCKGGYAEGYKNGYENGLQGIFALEEERDSIYEIGYRVGYREGNKKGCEERYRQEDMQKEKKVEIGSKLVSPSIGDTMDEIGREIGMCAGLAAIGVIGGLILLFSGQKQPCKDCSRLDCDGRRGRCYMGCCAGRDYYCNICQQWECTLHDRYSETDGLCRREREKQYREESRAKLKPNLKATCAGCGTSLPGGGYCLNCYNIYF